MGATLRLGNGDGPANAEQLLAAMQVALEYSTRTSHPLFFNQLYGGPEPVGIAGVLLHDLLFLTCSTLSLVFDQKV